MKIEDYFNKFPLCKRPQNRKDKTFGNYSIISEIFFPIWGEAGLDKLENEFNFVDAENNKRRIDFVLHGENAKYAIEVDDSTHYQASHEKYSDDQLKNSIMDYFDGKYRTIPLYDILNNKTRTIDTLLRFFVAEPEFNVNSKTFISGNPKPNAVQKLTLEKLDQIRKEGKNKGLVCYATGLGKTYLSAFDAKNFGGKTLFVVHRDEILKNLKNLLKLSGQINLLVFLMQKKKILMQILFLHLYKLYIDLKILIYLIKNILIILL